MAVRRKTCLYCGAPVRTNGYCTDCGLNQAFLKKAYNTSDYHYNIGLDKARVRDLSGAIDSLKMSLRYNKRNVNARNLLGLIYYELGETVMALSHWVMSANYQSKGNIAIRYLKEIRNDPKRLEDANQLARMFNQALNYAKQRDFDLAYIQLRKTLSLNPHFVNGYLLLSLLNIEQGRLGKARKALTKVLSIDRTNTMAIHLLKEMGETEEGIMKLRDEKNAEPVSEGDYYGVEQIAEEGKKPARKILGEISFKKNTNTKINRYKEVSMARFSNIYMLVGLVIGVLVLYFLVVPARTRALSRENEELRASYSEELSSKNFTISNLNDTVTELEGRISEYEEQISDLEATVSSLNEQINSLESQIPATPDDASEGGANNDGSEGNSDSQNNDGSSVTTVPEDDLQNMINNE